MVHAINDYQFCFGGGRFEKFGIIGSYLDIGISLDDLDGNY